MSHEVFTETHDELRDSIRRFVEREMTPHTDEWERDTFPDHVFPRMGELGFLGLNKPEEWGGQGGDYFTSFVLAEELNRGASSGTAMGIEVHTDMAMPPLVKFGSDEQKERWLAPAILGQEILCLGITEPDAGSDVAGVKTTARRDGSDYVINGSKTYITNGVRADVIVLVTRTDPDAGYDGMTLFLVPMDSPGVVREKPLEKLGNHSSDTALLSFTDVRVPATAVLGELGRGFHQIMWQLQPERLIGCAGSLAAAQKALDMTVEYVRERQAFGRTLSRFQVIRHRLAECATRLEAARELTYGAAKRFDRGEYPVREISMTKLFVGQVTNEVVDVCLQFHGGLGYMAEHPIQRLWRDLRLNRIGAGADEVMCDVVAKQIGL